MLFEGWLCVGSCRVRMAPVLPPCTPPGAARFFNVSASQTLLLSLLSARAIRFPTRFGLDFLQDLSCGDP